MRSNVDPELHPMEAAREYKRALNAGGCEVFDCVIDTIERLPFNFPRTWHLV